MSKSVKMDATTEKQARKKNPEEEEEIRQLIADLQVLEAEDDQAIHELNEARLFLSGKICDKYAEIRKVIFDEYYDTPLDISPPDPIKKEQYRATIDRVVDEKLDLADEIELTKKELLDLKRKNEMAEKTFDILRRVNEFSFEPEIIATEN